jgi:RecB family exonuclease
MERIMIQPANKLKPGPVLVRPVSPPPAGLDDTGTGVWIGKIEAAARLGVSERTLDALARDGMIERTYRRARGEKPESIFFLEQINRLLAARPAVFASATQQPEIRESGQISQGGEVGKTMIEEPPPIDIEPGELLSPSQVSTFAGCSAKWFYRYVLKLPSSQGPELAIGKALHATMKENFLQKIQEKRDLPLAGILAIYQGAWAAEEAVTEFRPDDDRAELKAMGAKLVTKYLEESAPLIDPAAVELPVEGIIAGVRVRGYVDLLDTSGRIVDLKSAKTSPSEGKIRPDYRFQIATYAALTPGASGAARLDTVVKLKREVRLVQQEFTITDDDRKSVETLYPLAREGMKSGLIFPNRSSLLCSRKVCSYANFCVADHGGEVL